MKFYTDRESVLSKVYEMLSLDLNLPTRYGDFVYGVSDEIFMRVLDTVRRKREEILKSLSYSTEASKCTLILLTLAPRSRRFLRNPPEEFYTWMSRAVESTLKGGGIPILPRELFEKFSRYLMFYDSVSDLWYINPTQREVFELEAYNRMSFRELMSSKVFHWYSYKLRYDWYNRAFLLNGRIIHKLGKDEDILDLLSRDIPYGIKYTIKLVIHDYIMEKIKDMFGTNVEIRRYSPLNGETVHIKGDKQFKKGVNLSFFTSENGVLEVSASSELSVHKFTVKDVIPLRGLIHPKVNVVLKSKIDLLLDKLYTRIEGYRRLESLLDNITHSLSQNNISINPSIHVTSKGYLEVEVRVDYDKPVDPVSFKDKIVKLKKKKTVSYSITPYYTTVNLKYTVNNAERVNSTARKVRSDLNKLIESLLESHKKYQERRKDIEVRNTKELLATYIVLTTHPEYSQIDEEFLMDEMNKYFYEIMKKHKVNYPIYRKSYMLSNYDEVLSNLITLGVIRVDVNKVEVEGERLYKILTYLGYDIPTSIMIEKEASNSLVSCLISLPPEKLIEKYDENRTFWDLIPENVKRKYPEMISLKEAKRILMVEKLSKHFQTIKKQLVWKIITESDNPSLKTEYVYKDTPEILGKLPKSAELVVEGLLTVIKVGSFYAQVYNVKGDLIEYIIYDNEEGMGFIYSGRTLMGALIEASKTHEEMRNKYRNLDTFNRTTFMKLRLIKKDGKPIRYSKPEISDEEEVFST